MAGPGRGGRRDGWGAAAPTLLQVSPRSERPVGEVTRGTTNPNRLRRVDRWLAGPQAWRLARPGPPPLVVDLGYGRTGTTARELHDRLAAVRADVEVVGLEIEPGRVAAARGLERPGLSFALGGFEVPTARPASVIRAFNVLRQYDEEAVPAAWARMCGRLEPGGLLAEGTCDELGRLATWVALEASGPLSLSISVGLRTLQRPSDVAARLPKALIHRNVPGEPVHDWLAALDDAWDRAAALAPYGRRQRFLATVAAVRSAGWPVLGGRSRWRLGEVTVAWEAVASSARG